MKKGLKVFLIVVACFLALALIGGVSAVLATRGAANADEYKMDDDVIQSVKAIVGKRDVSAVSTSVKNGIHSKSYTYQSSSVQEDLVSYVEYLRGEGGFSLTDDMDLSKFPATVRMAKQSVTQGEIIVLSIDYTDSEYTVTLQKGAGSITQK